MSVLIKGLNMPKCCCDCLFCEGHYYCKLLKIDLWHHAIWSERHSLCPIVEVPTPHGDLIDREELFRLASKRLFPNIHIGQVRYIAYSILPIVIESEE